MNQRELEFPVDSVLLILHRSFYQIGFQFNYWMEFFKNIIILFKTYSPPQLHPLKKIK